MHSCKTRRSNTHKISSINNLLPENPSSSSSSYVIGSNSELLIQILLYLPSKSLFIFKSVSKQWCSLISDPFFVRSYFIRNHRLSVPVLKLRKLSLLGKTLRPSEFISLDRNLTGSTEVHSNNVLTDINNGSTQIKQSCNGLVYCTYFSTISRKVRKSVHLIYNPSTKQFKTLPLSALCSRLISSVSLAFDPLKSPHYKVVLISKVIPYYVYSPLSNMVDYHIEIYSSETSSLRELEYSFLAPQGSFWGPGVFWKGSLHWIPNSIHSTESSASYYFDIDQELVKTMPMPSMIPDGSGRRRRTKYFGEYMGHMHLIEIYDSSSSPCFDILEMETDYTGWKVKYRVDLDGLATAYQKTVQGNSFCFSILLVKEGEEKSSKLVLQILNKLVSYDLNKMSFKEVHDLPAYCKGEGSIHDLSPSCYDNHESSIQYQNCIYAYQYIESLASV